MTTLSPVESSERIEILDILRGFALLGIIFNNMLYFSGYVFTSFDTLKQIIDFQFNEQIYNFLDIVIRRKFYTLFSILFAVGFYIQFNKYKEDSVAFIKTYRRRILILSLIGLIHSLIWYGDILLTYSIMVFILLFFRHVNTRNLLRLSIFFMLLPTIIDFLILPFSQSLDMMNTGDVVAAAHVNYPDMSPEVVIMTFQEGTLTELFFLNIHNILWKYLGYIPSGRNFVLLGIFIFGYYLASIRFFTTMPKSNTFLISTMIIGVLSTIIATVIGGNVYQFPSMLSNIFYKLLLVVGQVFMCLFYIISIFKLSEKSFGKKVLKHLIPVGKMALTNYLLQTIIMILIFYNFGFNLIGRIGLIPIIGIVFLVLALQIIMSNIWLKHYRFGPFEWMWRSLTYKKRLKIRNEDISY